jgi:hypothetical protein
MRLLRRLAPAVGVALACASAAADTASARVEAVSWQAAELVIPAEQAVVGRIFTVVVDGSYCAGGPRPRIHHVTVVERARTPARPFKSAVITVFMEWPEPEAVAPAPNLFCAGLGNSISKRVTLKRRAEDLFLYDGSYSPPRRVWPEPPEIEDSIADPGHGELR